MSYTLNDVDILRDISVNSITFKNSDTDAFIGCVHDSTYYTPNNTFVDFDFCDRSDNQGTNKKPLLINPWSGGASGGVVIGSRDASSLKGFSGGNYMLDVNGMIKCSTPPTANNDTSVATTAFVKAQSYATQTWVEAKSYITSSSLSGYATQTWVEAKGYATQTWVEAKGYATQSWVEAKGYITSSSLSSYATQTWVEAKGYITSSSLSSYATHSWVNANAILKVDLTIIMKKGQNSSYTSGYGSPTISLFYSNDPNTYGEGPDDINFNYYNPNMTYNKSLKTVIYSPNTSAGHGVSITLSSAGATNYVNVKIYVPGYHQTFYNNESYNFTFLM